ncbi:MAG: SMP-30/gluconolactonase/LRE family protein [Deltaproteobacteria bacterium]|nr:SMP-30/gluconolactonase/LRE family protein [Deltaproteobacteria bacterium]MBW2414962.1 SMP-30/gluconolactonase/LRE family protein [Deltaproteobacteria bacterium]
MSEIREIATGLEFPEGPVCLPDGSVLVVEIKRGTLSRVNPDGTVKVVAETGGGPNGAAIGPDGAVYVCNNGGFEWIDAGGLTLPGNQPANYTGGSIQRVDLDTGRVETLYTECDGHPLRGPNDLVFDSQGGFWFSDHGKMRERDRDRGGLYYALPDGSRIVEAVYPLDSPNGVGLSPDGKRLYAAETHTGRVFAWDVSAPGEIASSLRGELVAGLPGHQLLDSLAIDADGNVCVATIVNGGITIISPDGSNIEHVAMPDPLTTNICFGGDDLRTAYITLSATGKLVAADWKTPGLALAY